jgi:hypothetical protein
MAISGVGRMTAEKWEVCKSVCEGDVTIYGIKGQGGPTDIYYSVSPPNFLERFVGITFEDKIQKAVRKAQAECDKYNKEEETAKKVVIG